MILHQGWTKYNSQHFSVIWYLIYSLFTLIYSWFIRLMKFQEKQWSVWIFLWAIHSGMRVFPHNSCMNNSIVPVFQNNIFPSHSEKYLMILDWRSIVSALSVMSFKEHWTCETAAEPSTWMQTNKDTWMHQSFSLQIKRQAWEELGFSWGNTISMTWKENRKLRKKIYQIFVTGKIQGMHARIGHPQPHNMHLKYVDSMLLITILFHTTL